MVEGALTINGTKYTINDIPNLPEEIAVYKAAQKSMTLTRHFMANLVHTATSIIVTLL